MRHLKARGSDIRHIGSVAAHALDEIHQAIYGRAPQASRAWTDGDAILLVLRLPAPAGTGEPEPDDDDAIAAMQRLVAAAVYRRTGIALRAGGVNVDIARGLAVLAFERVAEPAPDDPLSELHTRRAS